MLEGNYSQDQTSVYRPQAGGGNPNPATEKWPR